MPHISELKESRFLKKEDCGNGILVTIRGCEQINVAASGQPEELKWCLSFEEVEKPMVLNSTNGQIIAGICGSDNTDDWAGRKVVLFTDPSISFGGKLVGGIRARAPRNQPKTAGVPTPKPRPAPAQPAPAPAPAEGGAEPDGGDSIPF